jgi:hypothetical protein
MIAWIIVALLSLACAYLFLANYGRYLIIESLAEQVAKVTTERDLLARRLDEVLHLADALRRKMA